MLVSYPARVIRLDAESSYISKQASYCSSIEPSFSDLGRFVLRGSSDLVFLLSFDVNTQMTVEMILARTRVSANMAHQ